MTAEQNGTLKHLSLDDILAAAPKPEGEDVEVPEWGGVVKVRGVTHAEMRHARRIATNGFTQPADESIFEREMFITAFVSPDGKRADAEQYRRLTYRSSAPLQRVLKTILRLSGLGEEAQREAAASFPERDGGGSEADAGEAVSVHAVP